VKLGADGGTAPYTWSVTSGSLPAGLKLRSNGTLSGTPSATGTTAFTVQVTDTEDPAATATASLTLTVAAPLTITTTSLPSVPFFNPGYDAFVYSAGGVGPYTWSIVSGSLPPDLIMEGQGASAEIGGILEASPGVYSFVVQVTDSANPAESATADLSITVTGP
jgi:Putative Ig domain